MQAETSFAIVFIACAVFFTVWLFALWLYLTHSPACAAETFKTHLRGAPPQHVRDALPRAAALQQPIWDLTGGDGDEAVFQMPAPMKRDVRVRVADDGQGGADVTCEAGPASSGNWYHWTTRALLIAGPVVVIAAGVAFYTHLAGGGSAATRAQTVQMIHLFHPIGPAFVVVKRARLNARQSREACRRFLTALELLQHVAINGNPKPRMMPCPSRTARV